MQQQSFHIGFKFANQIQSMNFAKSRLIKLYFIIRNIQIHSQLTYLLKSVTEKVDQKRALIREKKALVQWPTISK